MEFESRVRMLYTWLYIVIQTPRLPQLPGIYEPCPMTDQHPSEDNPLSLELKSLRASVARFQVHSKPATQPHFLQCISAHFQSTYIGRSPRIGSQTPTTLSRQCSLPRACSPFGAGERPIESRARCSPG